MMALRIEESGLDRLKAIADANGTDLSTLVRTALGEFVRARSERCVPRHRGPMRDGVCTQCGRAA